MPSLERRRFLEAATAVGIAVGGFDVRVSATEDDRIEWTADVDGIGRSSPTVVDGTVYVGANDAVYAFDAKTGDEEWTFDERGEFGTAIVADGTVYAGTIEGAIYAIDADSGDEVWQSAESAAGVRSPSAAYGLVYARANDGTVYAIDDDGDEVWRFTDPVGGEHDDMVSRSAVTVVDDTVYVSSLDGVVYAVDAASGEKRWQFDGGSGYTSPTVVGDTVYISAGTVYAVDAETGTETWEASDADGIVSSPTVADGSVYAGRMISDVSFGPKMYAIDADTGDVEREYSDGIHGQISAAPTVVEDTIFVATRDLGLVGRDRVLAVDTSGEVTWTFTDLELPPSEPIVVDGILYVRDYRTVCALDAGVNGSSEDSRVLLGTYNHHDREPNAGGALEWLADNWWLPAGTGAVGAGAAYAYSRTDGGTGPS